MDDNKEVCGNCLHSTPTDIDGLVDCQCDGCMKDDDMPCNIDNFEFKLPVERGHYGIQH